MKKNVLLFICFALFLTISKANIHLVQVANFQFSPASVTDVIVGDTMRWIWVSGSHTTTDDPATQATSLPAGAPTWNSSINSTSTTFDYKVTVAGIYNYLCVPHKANMKASFTASNALPVKVASFTVGSVNGKAIINWRTAMEQNIDYFSVRRSLNGVNYTEISKIPATGNSNTEKSYSFTDYTIAKSQYYYYNIAIVDKDRRQEFTETKMIKGDGLINHLILSLSPNPISSAGHLMLTFNANKEGKMRVDIINSQGQTVIKTQMQAYQGVNNGHVHMGALAPGNYTLVCLLDGIRETHQIIFK